MANKSVGFLTVAFGADLKGFDKAMKKAQRNIKKFETQMRSVGQGLTRNVTLPVVGIGIASVKMASDFEESLNKVRVSFGETSSEVENFARTTLDRFNIAEGSALEMASLFGDMGTAMGQTTQEAADMSMTLVGLAGDLASFKNIQIGVAQTALKGIFTGETEALKNLGIVVTESVLKQSDYFHSLNKSYNELTQLEKIQIRFNEVLRQTNKAQGDVVRTSDSFANQLRRVQEGLKQASADFGKELIPAAQEFLKVVTGLMKSFNSLTKEQKENIITFGGIAALVGPILTGFASLLKIIRMMIPFLTTLVKVFRGLHPVGRVMTLIAGGLVTLEKIFEKDNKIANGFKDAAKQVKFFGAEIDKTGIKINKVVQDPNFRFFMHGAKPKEEPAPIDPFKTGTIAPLPSIGIQEGAFGDFGFGTTDGLPMSPIEDQFKGIVQFQTELTEKQKLANVQFALFGDVVRDSMTSALEGTESFADAFIRSLQGIIKRLLIQLAVMTAIRILMGDSVSTALSVAKGGLIENLNVGNFANGGIISGPTLGLMGEYAGANSNPEVVAPLSKLKSMIGGGSQQVEVVGRISGTDIFLSNAKTSGNRLRSV
jgi:hypothetical protein|tara:strand:- start:1885 stop:3681 length:1797 start_codon:yes stop_codon:yes gene_type:complete